MSIVKIAPIGERVTEVNVEAGTSISSALSIAGVMHNDRTIFMNNAPAQLCDVVTEGAIITLANKMKGG